MSALGGFAFLFLLFPASAYFLTFPFLSSFLSFVHFFFSSLLHLIYFPLRPLHSYSFFDVLIFYLYSHFIITRFVIPVVFYEITNVQCVYTSTNQNSIVEEIKSRLMSGKACYHSVQNLLSSRLLSKNLKIKVYRNIILPVVLYGCETWSLTLQ